MEAQLLFSYLSQVKVTKHWRMCNHLVTKHFRMLILILITEDTKMLHKSTQ